MYRFPENGDAPFIRKKIGNGKPPSDVVLINSPIKNPFEVPIFQGETLKCMGEAKRSNVWECRVITTEMVLYLH
jgi:hypothetical protein